MGLPKVSVKANKLTVGHVSPIGEPTRLGSEAVKEEVKEPQLTDSDYDQMLALAMEQIEGHLRYVGRWKLKATVAKDKIQGTLQYMLASIRQGQISPDLHKPSESVPAVKPGDRVGGKEIIDSRGISGGSRGAFDDVV